MSRPLRTPYATRRLDPTHPFTRADARAAGIPISELRGSRFQKIFYDLYIAAGVEVTAVLRAHAALKVSPAGSVASHYTAAEIWGGVVPAQPRTHISVPGAGNRSERRGIHAHASGPSTAKAVHRGVPLTPPDQTFLDLASQLSLVELVVLGDSLVRRGRTSPGSLVAAADAYQGRGARSARRAARLVRCGVDSAMESLLRMLIVLAGLPEPQVNFTLRGSDGAVVMRFDLSYPGLKVIVEYDGRQHADDPDQWARDVARREELDRLGWRLIVVRAPDIYSRPDLTLHRVGGVLRERGASRLPGKLRPEWRQYFPVRSAA